MGERVFPSVEAGDGRRRPRRARRCAPPSLGASASPPLNRRKARTGSAPARSASSLSSISEVDRHTRMALSPRHPLFVRRPSKTEPASAAAPRSAGSPAAWFAQRLFEERECALRSPPARRGGRAPRLPRRTRRSRHPEARRRLPGDELPLPQRGGHARRQARVGGGPPSRSGDVAPRACSPSSAAAIGAPRAIAAPAAASSSAAISAVRLSRCKRAMAHPSKRIVDDLGQLVRARGSVRSAKRPDRARRRAAGA